MYVHGSCSERHVWGCVVNLHTENNKSGIQLINNRGQVLRNEYYRSGKEKGRQ